METDPSTKPRYGENRCRATSNGTGERCRKAAIRGATVCRFHGGAAPQVRAAAKRRLAEEESQTAAMRMLRQLGAEVPEDVAPIDHLLAELRQASLVAEWLGQQAVLDGPSGPLWTVWERERDRRAKLAKFAVDAGLDERRVQVAERDAAALAGVIRTVLTTVRGAILQQLTEVLVPPEPTERFIVLDQRDRDDLQRAVHDVTVGRTGIETVRTELLKLSAGDEDGRGTDVA